MFTQEDPIGLAGGANLYGFAGGDPVNFGDPFGLCPPKTMAEVLICTGQMLAPAQRPLEVMGTVALSLPMAAASPSAGAIGLTIRNSSAAEQYLLKLGAKMGNQMSALDAPHLEAAASELAGATSRWDHVTEVRNAMNGLGASIQRVKNVMGNPSLTADEMAVAQRMLSAASKLLDEARKVIPRQ